MVKRRKSVGLARWIERTGPPAAGPRGRAGACAAVAVAACHRRRDQRPGLQAGDVAQADPRRGSTASAPRPPRRMALAAQGRPLVRFAATSAPRLCTLMCTLSLKSGQEAVPEIGLSTCFIGDPGWIRTSDPQLRRLVLSICRAVIGFKVLFVQFVC